MALSPGNRLGPYEVVGAIGAGGMGEVYRASDTKLNREVALKILPETVASDAARLARFRREAQVLAALNHPNIASIYGLEDSSGAPALVMELVEGPTLAERIALGPMALEEAVPLARQICDALEAAHAKGIIHRDLKPANIKLTHDGQVKVLDFGLAKALDVDDAAAASASSSPTMSPTLTIAATRAGFIMGTAAYMSPEQARGVPVDKRADIWAFGVVLYEMLTGRTTFEGETVSDTLASVLKTDPDFAKLPADTPKPILRLLHRCLERDRRKRLRDIGDAKLELDAKEEATPATVVAASAPPRRQWLAWAALAAVPVAAGLGWWLHRPPPPQLLPAEFLLMPPEKEHFAPWGHVVSPDGRKLVVRTRAAGRSRGLYVRDLESSAYRPLPVDGNIGQVVFAPDGRSVAYISDGKRIMRVNLAGGSPVAVCDFPSNNARLAWSEQGVILLGAARSPLYRVSAGGGVPTPATKLNEADNEHGHTLPVFLPGGRYFLFSVFSRNKPSGIFVGDLESKDAPRRLMTADVLAGFANSAESATGILLYRSGDALLGVRFDTRKRVVVSDAFPVADQVYTNGYGVSVSNPARVLLASLDQGPTGGEELILLDRAGKKTATLSAAGEPGWGHLEFSPDGKRLLGNRAVGQNAQGGDVWSIDLGRKTVSRVTFESKSEHVPVWSADASRIYYMYAGELHAALADGTGKPETLLRTPAHHLHATPDGRHVLLVTVGGSEIHRYSFDKPGKSERLIDGTGLNWPQVSQDGRWIAYSSSETGRPEIYVQSFPPGKGKWQVSREGGRLPRWRRDGRELVFAAGDSSVRFFAADVRTKGDGIEFGNPALLFEARVTGRAGSNYFAMSPDGKQIAINSPGPEAQAGPLTLWIDWMQRLGR